MSQQHEVDGLSDRWADMVLEDEELGFEPTADAVDKGGTTSQTWSMMVDSRLQHGRRHMESFLQLMTAATLLL
nr:hypothetical protein Iba_chr07eCG7790 [Ipomoea batatas]